MPKNRLPVLPQPEKENLIAVMTSKGQIFNSIDTPTRFSVAEALANQPSPSELSSALLTLRFKA